MQHTHRFTCFVGGAITTCLCSALAHAQQQTFWVHGSARSCSDITQLDSALMSGSQLFFAGWSAKDYDDALLWSQSCAAYGWHIPGQPRIPLLHAQRGRALGTGAPATPAPATLPSATPVSAAPAAATAGSPGVPVQPAPAPQGAAPLAGGVGAPPPTRPTIQAPGASAPSAQSPATPTSPEPPVATTAAPVAGTTAPPAAPIATPAAAEPASAGDPASAAEPAAPAATAATATPGSSPDATAGAAAAVPAVPTAATPLPAPMPPTMQPLPAGGGAVAGARSPDGSASESDEDSLLSDQFFKQHFHHESLWVAAKANLDIGAGGAPNSAQMKNRITADKIVLYCARKANSGDSGGNRPLLWDWRWCESEESAAYNRLVAGNEFPSAGRAVLLGCAGVESYVYLERCMQTLLESANAAPQGP